MSVLIVTSLGDLVVDLHTNKCPLTCKNFLKLCKVKYYNGCLFHTVQKDFTAQTGDPTGTGTGGDSVYKFLYGDQARFFSDEIHIDLKHSKTGTVAMASAGENLNASQFYITLRDDLDYLDGKHTVFGEVAEGFETLTRINEAYVDEKGRPYKNIRIKHTYILEDPYDDPSQLSEFIPEASPDKPKDEVDDEVRLEDDWVPMDEQLNPAELVEVIRSKEAHSRAVVLESIGDIPDAEIKPPDNVLFVCKLNPVTEDEDLHTIFSRFGTVSSAEIIRDHKTGDSLCYAFIEFEDKRSCEQAYFKMDNALIDDRRIHVDFSQSVAKLWSQYRRKDQKGKGGGCFKCGSTDHIAKDCTGDATMQQPQAKYILKDDNAQRGGDNARYEMVFDGDNSQSPRRDIKHQRHDGDDPVVRKGGKENFKDHRSRRDQDMVDSNNRDRYGDRNRGHGGNGDNKARSERGARDLDYHADKKDRDRHMGRRGDDDYKRKDERDSRKRDQDDDYKRKDERDSRKRDEDDSYKQRDERELRKRDEDDGHKRKDERELRKRDEDDGPKRKDERESRKRDEDDSYKQKDERDSRKRDEDDNYRERRTSRDDRRNTDSSHLEGRNDRDYRKRPEGSGKQDMKIDSGRSKRSLGDEDYKNGRDDEDYRNKREEHGHKRQDIEADDDYKRRREDVNYKRRREDGDCRHRREERGHKRPDIESDDYPHRRRHGDRR